MANPVATVDIVDEPESRVKRDVENSNNQGEHYFYYKDSVCKDGELSSLRRGTICYEKPLISRLVSYYLMLHNKPAPSFELRDMDGEVLNPDEVEAYAVVLGGKIVLKKWFSQNPVGDEEKAISFRGRMIENGSKMFRCLVEERGKKVFQRNYKDNVFYEVRFASFDEVIQQNELQNIMNEEREQRCFLQEEKKILYDKEAITRWILEVESECCQKKK